MSVLKSSNIWGFQSLISVRKGINTGFICRILRIFIWILLYNSNLRPPADPKYLIIFGSIAILIVLIAAINFMNLSTAQSSRRAKEVGIKKIGGSTRGMLVVQFLSGIFYSFIYFSDICRTFY